jgi:energy-coupling factor transport system permease protein
VSLLRAFNFRRKNTLIHKLDPRTKLYLAIVLFVLSFVFSEIVVLSLILLFLLLVLSLARSLGQWFATLRGLSFLLIFIVLLNSLFSNLAYAIMIVVRLMDIMACFSIFFLTVHPDDLAQALIQLHVSFDFAFTLSMATRYVPTLAQEAQTIMDAQMSRGLEMQKGNMLRQIRNYLPIIVPLIICSIRRALSVAESLESRAFGSTNKRTRLRILKMARKDYLVVLLATLIAFYLIYVNFYVGLPHWAMWQIPL